VMSWRDDLGSSGLLTLTTANARVAHWDRHRRMAGCGVAEFPPGGDVP
jgi:hypothetical protein